tara:strand:- start:8349 stop:8555 length:207 start_codon:yes stop_codon:yes gene_type:complete
MEKTDKIILASTFVIFMAEAIIHYNIGKNENKKFKVVIPPTNSLLKMAVIVGAFSILNQVVIKKLTTK